MTYWADSGAHRAIAGRPKDEARRAAQEKANAAAGDCPNCGSPARVELIDVSTSFDEYGWIPAAAYCSQRCDLTDPEGYLAAIGARNTP